MERIEEGEGEGGGSWIDGDGDGWTLVGWAFVWAVATGLNAFAMIAFDVNHINRLCIFSQIDTDSWRTSTVENRVMNRFYVSLLPPLTKQERQIRTICT